MSVDLFFLSLFLVSCFAALVCGLLWLVADWGEADGSRC